MSKFWAYCMGLGVAYLIVAIEIARRHPIKWQDALIGAVIVFVLGFGYEFLRRKI